MATRGRKRDPLLVLNGQQARFCKKCQRVLPLSEFYIYRWGEQGQPYYRSACTNCWHHINSTNQTRYIQEDYMLYRKKLLIDGARQRARKAGLEFSLSLEWLETQDLTRCPISKRPFTWKKDRTRTTSTGRGHIDTTQSPSIDRIDSSLGYTPENCWVISRRMNTLKNDSHYRELFLIGRAVAHEIMDRLF